MTRKQLILIIQEAVRPIIALEMKKMKKLVETAVREEFNNLLNEAEQAKGIKPQPNDEYSLMRMVNEERDPVREQVQQQIFQGNDPITDALNQTANAFETGEANPANYGLMKEDLVQRLGYGDVLVNDMTPAQKIASEADKPPTPLPVQNPNMENATQAVARGMAKDYRTMMAKLDKKAQGLRGGLALRATGQKSKSNLNVFHDKTDKYEKEYVEDKKPQ